MCLGQLLISIQSFAALVTHQPYRLTDNSIQSFLCLYYVYITFICVAYYCLIALATVTSNVITDNSQTDADLDAIPSGYKYATL